jgi:hypothetical protein
LLELPDLFRQRHPPEQIGDAFLDRLCGIFVDVFFPVLVQVNPAVVIDGRLHRRNGQGEKKAAGKKSVFHWERNLPARRGEFKLIPWSAGLRPGGKSGNIEQPTSNAEHPINDPALPLYYSMFDVGRSMFDVSTT